LEHIHAADEKTKYTGAGEDSGWPVSQHDSLKLPFIDRHAVVLVQAHGLVDDGQRPTGQGVPGKVGKANKTTSQGVTSWQWFARFAVAEEINEDVMILHLAFMVGDHTIENRHNIHDLNFQAGLFPDFPPDSFMQGFPQLHQASWHRPQAVGGLAPALDDQHLITS
jgi:hypothetical protein